MSEILAMRTAGWPVKRRFLQDVAKPEAAQGRVLERLCAMISRTDYGIAHGVKSTDRYEAFRDKLPIVRYQDIEPWLMRQRAGECSVLVDGRVKLYEPTSGSSGPSKLIPYNAALQRTFHRMFLLWAGDIFQHVPLTSGKSYFSISPAATAPAQTEAGRQIGLQDDSDYLSPLWRLWARRYMAASPDLKQVLDAERFREALALQLLACEELEVISVWNASCLTVLFQWMITAQDRLLWLIARSGGKNMPSAQAKALRYLRSPGDLHKLWPKLKLVSAWASGHARTSFDRLHDWLPHATFQPKGLLATECPVTIPWHAAEGFVPLIGDVFLEFEGEDGRISLVHELQIGVQYALVVSQPSGLYRYRLGDLVKVTHFYGATPCLDFVGRGGTCSDLVGEKLTDSFVTSVLAKVLPADNVFGVVVPVWPDNQAPRYRLLLDRGSCGASVSSDRLDAALAEAHHYRLARHLGQLAAPEVQLVRDFEAVYIEFHRRRGMKIGDVKPQALITALDMSRGLIKSIGLGSV
jgi:hypothetical protein